MDHLRQQKEVDRLEALRRYNVLDTPPDAVIDSIVKAAAEICETPIAHVSLVDESRQWFKSALGMPVSETPREHSFCTHAIEQPDTAMVVEDASKDPRFIDNPLVVGEPNIRFYLGQPLVSPDGHVIGTLCVIDDKPRQLSTQQKNALSHLADVVLSVLNRKDQAILSPLNLAIEQVVQHGITITDPNQADNPMVFTNKAFELLTGYSQAELIGRNCRFLQGDNTDPEHVDALRDAVLNKSEVTVTLKNYRKDNTEFWNEITVSPIVDHNDHVTHFIGIQKDVSDRYKIDAALSQSRVFLESAPDAMIISDHNGDIKLVNSETARLYGYSIEELGAMNVDTLTTDEFRPLQKEYRARFISDSELRDERAASKLVGLTKQGEELKLDVRSSLIETDDGVLISASIRDISAKVEADEKLRKTQRRYQDLFENSSDLIQSINLDGSFSYTNPAWLSAFGYSLEEVAELRMASVVHPDSFEYCQNLFARAMSGESMEYEEIVCVTKSGDTIHVEGNIVTSVVNGEVKAIRTIARDITERKKTEKSLISSKDSAEAATAAKSRFLAAASHDLRQPLQSAGMYVATLARHLDAPGEAKDLCTKAAKSLDVMARLLDVLLDITKLDSGSITPNKRDVSLAEVFDNIATSNQQQAQHKGLRFSCEFEDALVYTDPALLERVIENFVGNAILYTESGYVEVTSHRYSSHVLITVSDSGIGIPSDKQDHIFEAYYQLGNEARDRRKGLGLGLSIVKRLANLLEHPLEMSSTLGVGSKFSVAVPLSATQSIKVVEPAVVEIIKADADAPIILLVDDDEQVLKSTVRLLKSYDMEVHSALNGDDALAMIADGLNPDFLISDFRLPHYDGIELIHRIRGQLSRDIPTAVMTGDTATPRIKYADLPNFTVMFKPIDLQRLLRLIDTSVAGTDK